MGKGWVSVCSHHGWISDTRRRLNSLNRKYLRLKKVEIGYGSGITSGIGLSDPARLDLTE
jgi:hypothetical protein